MQQSTDVASMDATQVSLIAELRKDARASLFAVASKLGIPPSTAHDRVRRNADNIIIKHTTLVDFAKLGLSRAFLLLRVMPEYRQAVQEYLASHPGTNNLHKIDSGYDFLLEIISADQKDMEDCIADIKVKQGVLNAQRLSVIEDIARERYEVKGGGKEI